MTTHAKLLAALPLALLLAGCVGANDQVDTTSELEAVTDTDLDADGTIVEDGTVIDATGT